MFSSIRGVEGGETTQPVKTLLKPTPFVNKRLHTHTHTHTHMGTVSHKNKTKTSSSTVVTTIFFLKVCVWGGGEEGVVAQNPREVEGH